MFTGVAVVCRLGTSLVGFRLFGLLEGGVTAAYAVWRAGIRGMSPARKASSRLSYVAVGFAYGHMVGPRLGGALDAAFGWRASFVAFVAFGAAVLAL